MQDLHDKDAVRDVILRVAHAMDMHDWDLCRRCFMDNIETDYSDLRGDPPAVISADAYVEKRRVALSSLKTLHMSTNHLITLNDNDAICHSGAMIYRYHPDSDDFFHTCARYEHRLKQTDEGWKISHIKQVVVWNTGNPQLHSGAKQEKS
ncbi:MAG: nuclear transport factor 2 family protein [Aggregatilineales bacterium]